MRSFLLNCINGPLLGVNSHHIHLLCDDYEFARHHYEAFDETKFKVRKFMTDSGTRNPGFGFLEVYHGEMGLRQVGHGFSSFFALFDYL